MSTLTFQPAVATILALAVLSLASCGSGDGFRDRAVTTSAGAPGRGREIPRLAPVPTGPATTYAGTVPASTVQAAIDEAPPGPLVIRPASGDSFVAEGDVTIRRRRVTISGMRLSGTLTILAGGSGAVVQNGSAKALYLERASDVTIRGNTFDGQGEVAQNWITNGARRFTVQGNLFANYYIDDGVTHSEALFVGARAVDGLIEDNLFVRNGTTGHIFFSWFGDEPDPAISYPRRICVRNNVFDATFDNVYDVQFRPEIPVASDLAVEPGQDAVVSRSEFLRPCRAPIGG